MNFRGLLKARLDGPRKNSLVEPVLVAVDGRNASQRESSRIKPTRM